MLHEATHQLNRERSGLDLPEWLDEGIACYFGASRLQGDRLLPGMIDETAYPVWWLNDLKFKLTGKLQEDIATGKIIPLSTILSGNGGPPKDKEFNRYYIHWWTLIHFLFEYDNRQYREPTLKLIAEGGASFSEHLGNLEDIQREWYGYVIFLQSRDRQKTTTAR